MRGGNNRLFLLTTLLTLVLLLSAIAAGCGGGASNSYQQAVLDGWSGLQTSSGELAEAANNIEDQADMEDFSGELAAAREEIASFEGELKGLKVPSEFKQSHGALLDFLYAYDEYLGAMEDMLNMFLEGEDLSTVPTIVPQLERAENNLLIYQNSQEYSDAELDAGIWDVLHILDEAIGSAVDNTTTGNYSKALEIVDAWYSFFNIGDGESMYELLDPESPILDSYTRQFFLAQVGEAYEGGLRATFQVVDAELGQDSSGDWYTAFLAVNYGGTVDMEGNPVPPSSEDIQFQLVNRGNGWYVYDIQNGSRIY